MLEPTSTPPTGPRRGHHNAFSTRSTPRGGIQKRSGPSPRVDKDGDLDMEAGASGRGRGRGRGNRGGPSPQPLASSRRNGPPGRSIGRPPGPRLDRAALQKAVMESLKSGDVNINEIRSEPKVGGAISEALGKRGPRGGLVQISVSGWRESKAASNPGGGIKQLLDFLERKATAPGASAGKVVKIIKVCF